MLNSVRKLDKVNDIDIELAGSIEQILQNPAEWAEKQVEQFIVQYQDKYFEAKQLGKEFWDEVGSKG